MRIITAGSGYVDIDAYGGCIAYAELLNLQGEQAQAASNAALNASIPPSVRAWQAPFTLGYKPAAEDTFTIIDTSDPEFLDKMTALDRVDEVIDHHPGFEAYWQKRLGDKADIEMAGAACTMIFERWEQAGLVPKMSQTSARLLICGTLDNTLNFKAKITTNRDHHAYEQLQCIADLAHDWPAQYFSECQQAITKDLSAALRDDRKIMAFKQFVKPLGVGQLVIWDASSILANNLEQIRTTMDEMAQPWFVNIVSIAEGKSYLVCHDVSLRPWLENLLQVHFTQNVAPANRLWLRKEILKASLSKTES
ncbi:MAG TPA: DHH family phosphoesterase [Candidatus Saccharimonadales bacterium]|nr:DHH family phosphoesterase [Candidatus Saccharimonadales bacterium]